MIPPTAPPPPAPSPDNIDPRVVRDQIRAQQRQLRDQQRERAKAKLRGVNSRYWVYGGAILAGALGVVACNSYQQDQRDTALALAALADAGQQVTATTGAPQVIEGILNPLDQLPLTNQAKWMIGAGGDGVLPPKRSTTVLVQMLEGVDMCGVYVGLSDKAEILVSFDPRPSFVPLVQGCAAEPGTTVPVPADPVPTTVAQ